MSSSRLPEIKIGTQSVRAFIIAKQQELHIACKADFARKFDEYYSEIVTTYSSYDSIELLLGRLEKAGEDEEVLDYLYHLYEDLRDFLSPPMTASFVAAASTLDAISLSRKRYFEYVKVFDTVSESAKDRSSFVFAETMAVQWLIDYGAGIEWRECVQLDAFLPSAANFVSNFVQSKTIERSERQLINNAYHSLVRVVHAHGLVARRVAISTRAVPSTWSQSTAIGDVIGFADFHPGYLYQIRKKQGAAGFSAALSDLQTNSSMIVRRVLSLSSASGKEDEAAQDEAAQDEAAQDEAAHRLGVRTQGLVMAEGEIYASERYAARALEAKQIAANARRSDIPPDREEFLLKWLDEVVGVCSCQGCRQSPSPKHHVLRNVPLYKVGDRLYLVVPTAYCRRRLIETFARLDSADYKDLHLVSRLNNSRLDYKIQQYRIQQGVADAAELDDVAERKKRMGERREAAGRQKRVKIRDMELTTASRLSTMRAEEDEEVAQMMRELEKQAEAGGSDGA